MGVKFSQLPEILTQNVSPDDCIAILDLSEGLLKRTNASHSSPNRTFGVGSALNYGHLKISDEFNQHVGGASAGLAASQDAVYSAHQDALRMCLTAWVGTQQQWNNLSTSEKDQYKIVNIIDQT